MTEPTPYPTDITRAARPKFPLDGLVQMGAEADPDYCDGDCSGFHEAKWENGVLTLIYTADEYSQHGPARAQFVEVGALVNALSIADGGTADHWRDMLSDQLGVELASYEPGERA